MYSVFAQIHSDPRTVHHLTTHTFTRLLTSSAHSQWPHNSHAPCLQWIHPEFIPQTQLSDSPCLNLTNHCTSNLCLILKHLDKDWKTVILTKLSKIHSTHSINNLLSATCYFLLTSTLPILLQHSPENQNCLPSITLHHSSIPPNITAIFFTNASIIQSLQN
jgi:hypothetical protein